MKRMDAQSFYIIGSNSWYRRYKIFLCNRGGNSVRFNIIRVISTVDGVSSVSFEIVVELPFKKKYMHKQRDDGLPT